MLEGLLLERWWDTINTMITNLFWANWRYLLCIIMLAKCATATQAQICRVHTPHFQSQNKHFSALLLIGASWLTGEHWDKVGTWSKALYRDLSQFSKTPYALLGIKNDRRGVVERERVMRLTSQWRKLSDTPKDIGTTWSKHINSLYVLHNSSSLCHIDFHWSHPQSTCSVICAVHSALISLPLCGLVAELAGFSAKWSDWYHLNKACYGGYPHRDIILWLWSVITPIGL